MAAGLGFKDFTTGEVLTAADVDGYLMQGIWVFASNAARDAAVTAPAEGNFAFTKDTNSLWYYDGAAWVASGATGDIEGVTAGVGISGGGTSGTVTVTNSMATAIDAKGDLVVGTGADTFSKLTVGANDTILVADSTTATGLKWAAPAGGGSGLTLIQRTSFSNVANTGTTFDGIFTSTYKSYQVVFEKFHGVTADNDPILEFLYSGSVQSTQYVGAAGGATYNSASFDNVQNSFTAQFTFGSHIGSSDYISSGVMWFSKVGNASEKPNLTGIWVEPNDGKSRFLGCTVDDARTYTGFRLRSSSTNVTGTVAVYGLAAS